MRKVTRHIIALGLSLGLACMSTMAFATESRTLDEIVNGTSTTTTQTQTTQTTNDYTSNQSQTSQNTNSSQVQTDTSSDGKILSSTQREAKEFVNNLSNASDMTVMTDTAQRAAAPLQKIVTIVVQVISYVLVLGLTLRVAFDLVYIVLPWFRGILGGNSQDMMQGQQPGVGNMGMNSMGGMGGMGGMSPMGGMGMNRGYMGMNRGMGMGMGMGGMQGAQQGMQPTRGIKLVSDAAIAAVIASQTPGPDGSFQSPFRIYVKDMAFVCILTPIMLILAMTGVLTTLGLHLGSLLAGLISNISASL